MVLCGRPPPRGCLSVSSVPPEEHGIEGPVPRPPGGPLVGPAQPPVHFPHQGEGLPPQRVRDCAPVPVPWIIGQTVSGMQAARPDDLRLHPSRSPNSQSLIVGIIEGRCRQTDKQPDGQTERKGEKERDCGNCGVLRCLWKRCSTPHSTWMGNRMGAVCVKQRRHRCGLGSCHVAGEVRVAPPPHSPWIGNGGWLRRAAV